MPARCQVRTLQLLRRNRTAGGKGHQRGMAIPAACAKLVLVKTSPKQRPNDAAQQVCSVAVTSLSHPAGARHGARRLGAAGSPRSASVAGPGRASPAARHLETRSAAVRRQRSRHTTAWLCRPTSYSASDIRRAAWVLPAPTLLLSIPQLWWTCLRTMLVGLAARFLVVTFANPHRPAALSCEMPLVAARRKLSRVLARQCGSYLLIGV